MKVEQRPSPNFNNRPAGFAVNTIVIHADADDAIEASISWVCNPDSRVSYHTIIGRTGRIYAIVPAEKRAWHAGVSEFKGFRNVNNFSVGLCFGNKNDGKEEYTDAALSAGALYVASLMTAYPAITYDRITTHAFIAMPPGRKTDPGPCFDMPHFIDRIRSVR